LTIEVAWFVVTFDCGDYWSCVVCCNLRLWWLLK